MLMVHVMWLPLRQQSVSCCVDCAENLLGLVSDDLKQDENCRTYHMTRESSDL